MQFVTLSSDLRCIIFIHEGDTVPAEHMVFATKERALEHARALLLEDRMVLEDRVKLLEKELVEEREAMELVKAGMLIRLREGIRSMMVPK